MSNQLNDQKVYFLNKLEKHAKAINFDYKQKDAKEKLKEIFSENMEKWVRELIEWNIKAKKLSA
jgi:hypothetical protein